jgi:hypothetical protein
MSASVSRKPLGGVCPLQRVRPFLPELTRLNQIRHFVEMISESDYERDSSGERRQNDNKNYDLI